MKNTRACKEKPKKSKAMRGLLIADAVFVALLGVQLLLRWNHLHFFGGMYIGSALTCVIVILTASVVLLWLIRKNKNGLALAFAGLSVAVFMRVVPVLFLFSVMGPNQVAVYVSPDEQHTVVLMEDGYFDKTYTAGKKLNGLMYKSGDGYVSYRDMWGGGENYAQVVWVSDKEVRIEIRPEGAIPTKGSNADGVITVRL